MHISSSYAKILGETNFRTREIPRSGSKAEDGEKKKERKRERKKERKYVIIMAKLRMAHASTHGARKAHASRLGQKSKEECESAKIESEDSESNIATTSSKNRFVCEHCEYISSSESCMESHVKKDHVWECKYCGKILVIEDHLDEHVGKNHECKFCDMKTITGEELHQHKRQKHEIKCKLCKFEAQKNWILGNHMIEKHEYTCKCNVCGVAFKMESKLSDHICKVELRNPKFDTLYTRDWYNANGCNAVYCTTQNRDVAMIHADKCWSNKVKCFWPRKEKTFVKHFQLEKVIKNEEIHWETLLEEIKPTFIRLIDSHTNLEHI